MCVWGYIYIHCTLCCVVLRVSCLYVLHVLLIDAPMNLYIQYSDFSAQSPSNIAGWTIMIL